MAFFLDNEQVNSKFQGNIAERYDGTASAIDYLYFINIRTTSWEKWTVIIPYSFWRKLSLTGRDVFGDFVTRWLGW